MANNNKLKLNISKTKAMLISTPYKYKQINLNEITLTIDSTRIEIVEETKYLGLVIDSHLNFIPHFNYIHKKILKKIYFFSRVSQNLSCNTRITVYNTIIKTHFEYCATVLYSLDLNKMLAVQKLQNRAMRIILKCNRYTPISNMLSCLQWLNTPLCCSERPWKQRFFSSLDSGFEWILIDKFDQSIVFILSGDLSYTLSDRP
ncbi:hypothetical protein NQ317_000053 [Molorchus minor]|uniref:Reverse transcriptase domain-containing protein n=1 Tax=Molorchus minor TaxID=1323400 RepID=A0ABQ9JK61_9CUCU|nr:hypothetical protein NQ317_000053 [Molorchus minor]